MIRYIGLVTNFHGDVINEKIKTTGFRSNDTHALSSISFSTVTLIYYAICPYLSLGKLVLCFSG